MINELREELKSTPREVLIQELEGLKEFTKHGPSAESVLENWNEHYKEEFIIKNEAKKTTKVNASNELETLNYSESFFCLN